MAVQQKSAGSEALTGAASADIALRTVIADDDPLVRRVLRDTLQEAGLIVVAEAASGRDALALTIQYRPDVLLLDLAMPDGDGIEVLRRLRQGVGADVAVVALTASEDADAALEALRAGADGYLNKDMGLAAIPRTLRAAANGEAAISRRLTRLLIDRLRNTPNGQVGMRPVRSPLTPREWEVLDLLCIDASTDEIAESLVLSLETVRSHIKRILRKLDVGSRREAVAVAARIRGPVTGSVGL